MGSAVISERPESVDEALLTPASYSRPTGTAGSHKPDTPNVLEETYVALEAMGLEPIPGTPEEVQGERISEGDDGTVAYVYGDGDYQELDLSNVPTFKGSTPARFHTERARSFELRQGDECEGDSSDLDAREHSPTPGMPRPQDLYSREADAAERRAHTPLCGVPYFSGGGNALVQDDDLTQVGLGLSKSLANVASGMTMPVLLQQQNFTNASSLHQSIGSRIPLPPGLPVYHGPSKMPTANGHTGRPVMGERIPKVSKNTLPRNGGEHKLPVGARPPISSRK